MIINAGPEQSWQSQLWTVVVASSSNLSAIAPGSQKIRILSLLYGAAWPETPGRLEGEVQSHEWTIIHERTVQ